MCKELIFHIMHTLFTIEQSFKRKKNLNKRIYELNTMEHFWRNLIGTPVAV